MPNRQQAGTDCTDAAGLSHSGNPGKDRPKHHDNQHQRRQHGEAQVEYRGDRKWLGRHHGSLVRQEPANHNQIDHIESGQQDTGKNRPHEEITDRHRSLVGHDHQHDARWHEDAERSGRADSASGQWTGISLAKHDWQADQPQQHHRGPDDTGARRQQHTDQDNTNCQATVNPAKEPLH